MFRRKTKEFQTQNGIAELFELDLGGRLQYILIRGENKASPILLFLHGGPGTSNIGIAASTQRELEKNFVVVNWDQLGAGLSYKIGIPNEAMNIEKIIGYTKELMEYLLKRFKKEKLFLVGHSWGSLIGLLTVNKYPEYIEKYVGVSQFVGGNINEKIAYDYCVERANATKNKKALKQLEAIGTPPYKDWMKGLQIRSNWSNAFGATVKSGSLPFIYMKAMLKGTEYRFTDIFKFMSGFTFSLSSLWPEVMKMNLEDKVTSITVPSYFFLGRNDYTAPSELAKEYIDKLNAIHKEIVWFENSAHMCLIEEQKKFISAITEKLLNH